MPKDESKQTRREFLKYTAMTTAMGGVWYSTAMKTDAAEEQKVVPEKVADPAHNPGPYLYPDAS